MADFHDDVPRIYASMRPRPDAAENVVRAAHYDLYGVASMRPRPDAAENPAARRGSPGATSRFNEAAARCRGKHPRQWTPRPEYSCFNEAAARCRGKRSFDRDLRSFDRWLQ